MRLRFLCPCKRTHDLRQQTCTSCTRSDSFTSQHADCVSPAQNANTANPKLPHPECRSPFASRADCCEINDPRSSTSRKDAHVTSLNPTSEQSNSAMPFRRSKERVAHTWLHANRSKSGCQTVSIDRERTKRADRRSPTVSSSNRIDSSTGTHRRKCRSLFETNPHAPPTSSSNSCHVAPDNHRSACSTFVRARKLHTQLVPVGHHATENRHQRNEC